jgi:DNA-binding PadR family transcriptional regulator
MPTRLANVSELSPEYVLLGLLALQPAHGYDLHQRLSTDLGQVWHIRQNQVYNLLKRLEARGDIHGTLQAQDKRPSRRFYQLTPTGRGRFDAWLATPTGSSARAIRVEFVTRLYFARHTSQALVDSLIEAQIAATRQGLDRLIAAYAGLPSVDIYNRLGVDLRIRQIESILRWLEECRDILGEEKVWNG